MSANSEQEAKETQRKSGHLSSLRSIFTILRKGSFNETAAWLAQYAERRSAGPEVWPQTLAGPTLTVYK